MLKPGRKCSAMPLSLATRIGKMVYAMRKKKNFETRAHSHILGQLRNWGTRQFKPVGNFEYIDCRYPGGINPAFYHP